MPKESNWEKLKPKLTTDQLKEIMELTEKKEETIIKAINPEKKEIELNLETERQKWQKFYEDHNFKNKVEIPEISLSLENIREIEHLIEQGFIDKWAIIPDHLSYQELEPEMAKGYEETYLWDEFKKDGGFEQLDKQETTEQPQYRLLFYKQAKELDQDPILKQTLGKSAEDMEEWLAQTNKKEKTNLQGISLKEYLIIQRQFLEQNNPKTKEQIQDQQNHLDVNKWTWCLKSKFPSSGRVAGARWDPRGRRLVVSAADSSDSYSGRGARLSRSFLLKK